MLSPLHSIGQGSSSERRPAARAGRRGTWMLASLLSQEAWGCWKTTVTSSASYFKRIFFGGRVADGRQGSEGEGRGQVLNYCSLMNVEPLRRPCRRQWPVIKRHFFVGLREPLGSLLSKLSSHCAVIICLLVCTPFGQSSPDTNHPHSSPLPDSCAQVSA